MAPDNRESQLERLRELEARLEEAEETLRALRSGEVDAIVASGPEGDRVYTLKGADEPYRAMVQRMAEGALTLSLDGLILFANEQFASMVHCPLGRVIGGRFQDFVDPEDATAAAGILAGDGGAKGEVKLIAAGAIALPVYLSAQSLVLEDCECLCVIVTDLSEQKRNQEIVAAEKLARSILEQAAEAILVVDPEGRISHASRAAEELAGAPVIQRRFDEVLRIVSGAGEPYPFRNILSSVRRTQAIRKVEAAALTPDGRRIELLLSAALLAAPDSTVLGCVLNLTDITERTLQEARERRRVAELEGIMEAVPAMVTITHDPDCTSIVGNRMAYKQLGVPFAANISKSAPESERPKTWQEMKDGRPIPIGELPMQIAARTGEPVPACEFDLQFEDGSTQSWFGNVVPLLDESGRSRGAVGAFVDITERKRADFLLQQSQKLESIGLLAGGIAHDFNNLLVGVIGNASLAQEIVPRGSAAIDLLQGVIDTGEQLANLTRQMLAYAGKGRFFVEHLNLSDILPEMTRLIQPSVPKKITVEFHLAPGLPLIEADRGQIQQVLMNLVLNAAEAIGTSAGRIIVKTAIRDVDRGYLRRNPETDLPLGKYVCLEVSDTGCGMDAETKSKVFDPFFSTKFTGRGLGLAAVSGIVRGHKGAIEVTSSPGRGSSFSVLFPAVAGVSGPHPEEERHAVPDGSGTILLVDDEEVVRQMAQRALTRHGYDVLLAKLGLEAIDVFKRHPGDIALVVLDLSMPGMGGEEVLPRLRQIRPGVKVVVSSGYSEIETMALFKGQQVSGFIQKPYTSQRLAEKVKSILT